MSISAHIVINDGFVMFQFDNNFIYFLILYVYTNLIYIMYNIHMCSMTIDEKD